MLQTLLTDRFKLIAHRDTQQGQIYTLTVGKNGRNCRTPRKGEKLHQLDWARTGNVHGKYNAAGVDQYFVELARLPRLG
jgi:uncharacterized protein (TIGR03435 family)